MAIDVSKPSSSDYPTKPTPPVSPPPHRDYQRNKNQTIPTTTTKDQDFDSEIPTITTKDQAIDVPPGISDTSDQDFNWFTFDPTTATTTATTADQNRNQKDSSEMTLEEEFQQWEEEQYEAEDRAEQAAWPKSKWEILAADMNADIFAPIKATTTATITENDDAIIIENTTIVHTTDNVHTNTIPDHEFHTIRDTTDEASDTITCCSSDSTVCTTNTASVPKTIENTTTVHATDTTDTTTTGDEEEIPSPTGMFDIDDEFTTSNTTEEDEKGSKYYDNIDHEIFRNEESTSVFEENSSAPATATNNQSIPMTTANDIISKISQLFPALPPEQTEDVAQIFINFAKCIDETTVEYVVEMLVEDPADEEDTREFVRAILMEELSCDIEQACEVCDAFFAFFDWINTISDHPIMIPPTNTKIRPTPTNTKIPTTTNKTITPPKDRQVPVISNKTKKTKKKQKQATPPKTKTKTTHEIKRPIVTVEEVNRYLQHVQNNSDLDEFPMNNLPIRTQIAQCEVAYYKMRNTNPVLAEVDMEFYHSLPPVQELLGEMTRLENLAMKLAANDYNTTNNSNTTTTATHTVDRPQPRIHTDKDTISTTEPNNNNNNNNKTSDNPTKADDDKRIAEQARETKRKHKQAVEREQEWHYNNNKRLRSEANERETEKEKEREIARRRCETARLELARHLPKKQQQTALKQKQHQVQSLQRRETHQQQAQQLQKQKEQSLEQMKQQQEQRKQHKQVQEQEHGIEQHQISENRKIVSAARSGKGKRKKKVQCVSNRTSGESRTSSVDPGTFGMEFGMQMIADQFGDGWHKTLTRFSGVQRIAALFGDGVT